MAVKVTLGEVQAKALLKALSVGIDNMQDDIDHDGREAPYRQSEVRKALEAYKRVDKALDEARLRSMASE